MDIKYIKQPTGYLCGQACVAMLANVSVDEVIKLMNNDKGTSKKEIADALKHYGIKQAKTMTKADNKTTARHMYLETSSSWLWSLGTLSQRNLL